MFNQWRLKRARKRKQALCDHDWHVLRTYRTVTGSCIYTMEFYDAYDVYCPKCGASVYEVSDVGMARIEGVRKAKRSYTEKLRKGDDNT